MSSEEERQENTIPEDIIRYISDQIQDTVTNILPDKIKEFFHQLIDTFPRCPDCEEFQRSGQSCPFIDPLRDQRCLARQWVTQSMEVIDNYAL
jgi:hypothetical protein